MGTSALLIALALSQVVPPQRQDSNMTPAPDSNTSVAVEQANPPTVFQPDHVKILGVLDYGKASASVDCSGSLSAFVFEGYGGDQVEIRVTGTQGTPFVALADSALREVTRGTSQLQVSLPNHGPAIEAWYILFRNPAGPGQVTVQVNKASEQSKISNSNAVRAE